jgi:hypothetical protein
MEIYSYKISNLKLIMVIIVIFQSGALLFKKILMNSLYHFL